MYWFSVFLSLPSYIFFKLPEFILKRVSFVQEVRSAYPTHDTVRRKPSLRLLAHNWFDNLTPPIAHYYNEAEREELFRNLPFSEISEEQGIFRGKKI